MQHKPIHLGQSSQIPASPEEAVLDRVPNPHPDTNYVARFTFPEFTVMCPVTGQPDFAIVVIDYVPNLFLVESKSLKLYLNSFRNHAAFHEDCTVGIGKRLFGHLKPRWLRIGGYFHPRGGMPIDVFWQAGRLPRDVWAPDPGVRSYRGRESTERGRCAVPLRDRLSRSPHARNVTRSHAVSVQRRAAPSVLVRGRFARAPACPPR